jgi:aminoglycoside phosphotransferase (APT) family kinase protein
VLLVTIDDGTPARLRRFPDAAAAARVEEALRCAADDVLPVPLARAGCWLATTFVAGRPIGGRNTSGTASRWLAEAAGLLARIHASPCPRHSPTAPATYARAISLAAGRLARAHRVQTAVARRLTALPRPAHPPVGLTHGDFSPSNLIVTPSRQLAVVDEERVAVRPVAYDVARVVCLWRLDRRAERRFLSAYATAGGKAASFLEHRAFWIAAALATSILYRLRHAPSALPPVVAAFRDILSTPSPRRRARR